MAELPLVMGPEGLIPQTPIALRQQLLALAASMSPGYTANLPSSLIEDISSTDVAALVIQNQFLVDLINSVTPYGANPFILHQLGIDIYGIQPAASTNTAVDVIFVGTKGFIIIPGFTVGDGTYQYICTDGGVIGTDGESLPIHAIATEEGTWPVPAGTVTQFITSVPIDIELVCFNPSNGIPSFASESETSFRTRVMTAGLAASTGMDRYLKTLLWNIPGVVQRCVSVRQNIETGRWTVLVLGGDPYQVAWAIYYALFDIQTLDRPPIYITSMSRSNPIHIQTENNHNLPDTSTHVEKIDNLVGSIASMNGQEFVVTVIGPKTLSIPIDGTAYPAYVSGGTMTPNPILQEISINSYPDVYIIPFIIPAQQVVRMTVIWNTDSPNYVSPTAVAQAAAPALADYVNSLYVGISPINIYNMEAIFINSLVDIVPAENIIVLDFEVYFDDIRSYVEPSTGIIPGDINGYFYSTINGITVVKG
jgi:hypothetical protein